MQKIKENKGITLIALVITIIVLLILAGVSIAALSGENGILLKAKEAKENTKQAQNDEQYALQSILGTINSVSPSEEGFNPTNSTEAGKKVNSPKITKGMIPIKYADTNNDGKKDSWVVCEQNDTNWYNYDGTKQWANIMLSDGKYKSDTVQVEQVVQESELGSMYVWIPRYAYKIAGEKNIDVTFLKGNTNVGADNVTYTTDENTDTKTTAIVHPAFNSSGAALTGIWVAKFEASGTDKNGNAVGNASSTSGAQQYAPDATTIAKSLPNKISWRHITIGESETRSMAITTTAKDIYGINYASSHLMKNDEWGAVAYLCYSNLGSVPMTNGTGSLVSNSHWYDLYTGQGPKSLSDEGWYNYSESHNYDTDNGILASTTGNVTGIYDMNGGAWERVAAYLDNGNGNLGYGVSADGSIKYFENGKLNSAYSSIWNAYTVSEEEKNNAIKISDTETLKQMNESNEKKNGLWDWAKRGIEYQKARLRLTKATFDNMASHKGIGVNEVSSSFSFYAPYTPSTENNSQPWGWFKTAEEATAGSTNYARTWDNDYVLIGKIGRAHV